MDSAKSYNFKYGNGGCGKMCPFDFYVDLGPDPLKDIKCSGCSKLISTYFEKKCCAAKYCKNYLCVDCYNAADVEQCNKQNMMESIIFCKLHSVRDGDGVVNKVENKVINKVVDKVGDDYKKIEDVIKCGRCSNNLSKKGRRNHCLKCTSFICSKCCIKGAKVCSTCSTKNCTLCLSPLALKSITKKCMNDKCNSALCISCLNTYNYCSTECENINIPGGSSEDDEGEDEDEDLEILMSHMPKKVIARKPEPVKNSIEKFMSEINFEQRISRLSNIFNMANFNPLN